MRICYLADGQSIHTHRWLSYFSERGHQMHLLSFAPMEPHHILAVEESGGRYQGQISPFHLKRFWHTVGSLLGLRRLLRRERIDVLHCHFLGVNAWYAALSRFHPLVISVMGGDVCGPDWSPPSDIRERILTPLALRKADLITCWSNQLAQVVRRHAPPDTPVEIIHGGVDLRRFSPGPRPQYLVERFNLPPRARVIFSSRWMRPLYNLDRIALAAREVCAAEPNAYFLFAYLPGATDEAYETRVREIVDGHHATAERVRFIGAIPHQEMADHFRLADVTVSIPVTDGTPMTVLESMACGTPVVIGDIPDYDTNYFTPGETVLAVNPDDEAGIAAALLRLLREPELVERLTLEARRRVEATGGYESQMSRMEQLYQNLF